MSTTIDRTPMLLGAAMAAGIAVAAGMAQKVVGSESSLTFVLLLIILGAMTFGGYFAARSQPEVGLTAGGQAALLGAAVAQLLNFAYAVTVGGKSPTIGNLAFIGFIIVLSSCFGVLGGYYAFRRDARAGGARADDDDDGDGDRHEDRREIANANGGDPE